jgi:hypothetical protein
LVAQLSDGDLFMGAQRVAFDLLQFQERLYMRVMYRLGGAWLLTLLFALPLSSRPASAQTAPPIGGFTGTYVPDATVKGEYEGAHDILEGVDHLVGYAKKLFGIKGGVQDPLDGFTEGRKVVLREGTESTEGVVIDVNRSRQQITVRLEGGTTETLKVGERSPAADAPAVIVSYKDAAGATVTRDFKKVS